MQNRLMRIGAGLLSVWAGLASHVAANGPDPGPLAGTALLERSGDIASELVAAADLFLLDQLDQATRDPKERWRRNGTSPAAYKASITTARTRLGHLLGLHDDRPSPAPLSLVATTDHPARLAGGNRYDIFAIEWSAFGDVKGEGLLLVPVGREPVADIVAIAHCDVSPEQLCGLEPGLAEVSQYARRLAESGCRVVVPVLVERSVRKQGISHREWLHRAAYVMGRTMTGYEVQKVLAVVDSFQSTSPRGRPVGVIGWGDGGLISWYAGAVDPRIDVTAVSGAFGQLDRLWSQPADRMVFSVVKEYGDVGLAAMIAPRDLLVETGTAPEVLRPRVGKERGAPYEIIAAPAEEVAEKVARARQLAGAAGGDRWLKVVASKAPGSEAMLGHFLQSLSPGTTLAAPGDALSAPESLWHTDRRQARQQDAIDRHTQELLRKSHHVRQRQFWDKLDTTSVDAYLASVEPFRQAFSENVVGHFDLKRLAANPRTRLVDQSPKWRRYEVVLDVFDGLFAYGLLTVPVGIVPSEQRPVVVCQHGLNGRAQSVVGEERYHYYKAFATTLAERGFVTFAPQNLYLLNDRFRTLQRKSNTLGKTIFALITPQHQQIVDWLGTLDFVDPQRIAFYGMSYGGRAAMRITPLVSGYCVAICSGDFNEWVDKNASTANPRSYVNSHEYESFEWNLGHTFNYAEMAALIAPRPFMVERGHHDFVADDWTVAWEYARVRFLYAAQLGIPDRTTIEWFDGPHTIFGQGAYDFLHHHLKWPAPSSP